MADTIDDVVRYPLKFQFSSREQLEGYFQGDIIVCLQCGGHYKALDPHLNATHGMTGDEYREMYRIPWTRQLMADDHVQMLRDNEGISPIRDKYVEEHPEEVEQHLREMIAMPKRPAVRLPSEKRKQRRAA